MLVLFETPAGFALFKVLDEGKLDKVEDLWKEFTTSDSARRVVELKAFNKFENTSDALSAATLIIDSKPSKGLRKFLQKHCEGETLAVAESKLGNAIKEKLKIDCIHNSAVMELMRGLRNQLTELITGLGAQELGPMSLGLSHSLSRYKLKFSPEKVDTMIIQAIGLLDDLDKELNTYAMRVREWYGWHFPELTKIVTDNIQYAKVVKMMGNRANAVNLDFSEILSDEEVEAQIKEAAVISMGTEVNDLDLLNIRELCDQVLALSEYRGQLFDYLKSRMNTIAPNLTALVGELVGARLIAHGGSLVNLAKQPGSTIQILGAEKALFRALKTKHSTPKYGLIYHASLIGKASQKHKGKISRSLAAKTALAIRCDALGDGEDNSIGIESRLKLETRLQVLENKEFGKSASSTKGKPKIEVYEKDRKKGAGALITPAKTYNPAADVVLGQSTEETPKKSDVASKKRKHHDAEVAPTTEPAVEAIQEDGDQERKKKKKKKKDKETEETPAANADGEKKKKKKSKESVEPAVAAAEGEKKKKKKSDADGELLYRSCRRSLASVLSNRPRLPPSMNSSTRLIEQILPFAREAVDLVLEGLGSEHMMVSPIDLDEFSNFFKVMCQQARHWISGEGPMPRNLYSRESEHGNTWIWRFHNMSMDVLKRLDECLKKLEMDLSLSSESTGVMESQTIWAARSFILVVLTELNFISAIYEDVGHNLQLVLMAHRAPLNALVRCSKRNEHLHWLVKHKNLLCFEARRNLIFMMLPEGKDDFGELHEMLIDRSHLLDESFNYIAQARHSELRGGLFMEFKNEEATGPGVLREWFCLVCQALFSPKQVLFSPCPEDKRRFYLNETSAVDPLHLKYFTFAGRIIGLALMHKVQVGIVLDRTLFLHLAGRSITLEDISVADPVKYASCKRILEMNAAEIDDLYLTFSRGAHELGTREVIDLCPGGQEISVNIRNREQYIELLIKNTFVDSISAQLTHFTQGFTDILVNPERRKDFFECLDLEDLDRLLGGSNDTINLQDWKSHTQYNGYKEKDRLITWFWKAVERMPIEQQRQLLFFWTSVKYLPSEGFGGLSSKLYIYKTSDSPDRLPSSQTCFYRLCLPPYTSSKMVENQLQKITQEHVSCSFGTW